MKLNITSINVRLSRPKSPLGEGAAITLDSGAEMGFLRATIPADIPDNAVVTKADIVLAVKVALTGSRTVTAQRADANPKASKTTWTNKPGVTGSAHSVTVGASAAGTEVRIAVDGDAQAFIAGSAVNRGWRISTSDTSRVAFIGSLATRTKPYLDLEYILPGDPPADLTPNGAAVSVSKPTLQFAVPDDTIAIRVLIDAGATIGSPDWDSGEVAYPVGLLDLTGTSYPGLSDGATTYWTARAKGAAGWTDYADWATLTRNDKPVVTITSPDTETGDKTPPITWEAADQASWRVRIYNHVTGELLDDSGHEAGVDQDWTPANGLNRVGQQARIVVQVWDVVDRVATPGVPEYATATLVTELVDLADVAGVDSISATSGIFPYVRVAWSGPEADEWQLVRDGKWLDRIDGSLRVWRDYYAKPGRSYTYRVLPVITGTGVARNGPSATVRVHPPGLWLFDENEVVFLLDHEIEATWDERAVVHEVLGDAPAVRRRSGMPPPRGTASGHLVSGTDPLLAAAAMADTALSFKASDQGRVYRMAYGDRNIPVTIGDLMVEPLNGVDGPVSYEVSFKWWQTRDELPWEA